MKILICVISILTAFPLLFSGTDDGWSEKRAFSKKIKNKRIVVSQVLPSRRSNIQGILPSQADVQRAAERFYKTLDQLPDNFVSKSGLKYVTFLKKPQYNNIPVGGLASGSTIILNVNFSPHTLFHEFFHIFDMQRDAKRWNRLNNRKFIYTGSVYHSAKLSRSKRKKKDQNLASKKFHADFISVYAMSNEREDRAETFAAMMVEGKRFLLRTKKSSVLQKKMEFIIHMTGKRKLMGRDFWQEKLGLDTNARNKE